MKVAVPVIASLRLSARACSLAVAGTVAATLLSGCEQRSTTVQTPTGTVTTTTVGPTPAARQELGEAASAASAALSRAGPVASRALDHARDAAAGAASQVRESASSGALARAGDAASTAMSRAGDVAADAAITAKVKAALLADARVKGLQVKVETHDRVVTLTGNAEARAELDVAAEIARRIDGVKSVDTQTAASKPAP